MKFEKVLETANRESVITTGLLLAGDVESAVPQAQPCRRLPRAELSTSVQPCK